MAVRQVAPGLYMVPLGMVNVYLFEDKDALVLVDTGIPGSTVRILAAVRELGRQPTDVKRILVTHLHGDHTGSLARLKQVTGATVAMHATDAELVSQGRTSRPSNPAPGVLNWLVVKLFMSATSLDRIEPVDTDDELADGDLLDVAGGVQVIHVPGHAAGQVAFLWSQHGGVLLAADAASNMVRLGYPFVFEDEEKGKTSLQKLTGLEFETACFGHGAPIIGGAAGRFRQKWH